MSKKKWKLQKYPFEETYSKKFWQKEKNGFWYEKLRLKNGENENCIGRWKLDVGSFSFYHIDKQVKEEAREGYRVTAIAAGLRD